MPTRIHLNIGLSLLLLCLSGRCLAVDEPVATLDYSFVVSAWFGNAKDCDKTQDNDPRCPMGMLMKYYSMDECREARELVLAKIIDEKDKYPRFGYVITNCERAEKT